MTAGNDQNTLDKEMDEVFKNLHENIPELGVVVALGQAEESVKSLIAQAEKKEPSPVFALYGKKLTMLRESTELTVFDIDGQVYSVVDGDIADREKKAEVAGRIDELTALLSQVPMPSLSYEQVQNRIKELK